jgi:hypothetical protein
MVRKAAARIRERKASQSLIAAARERINELEAELKSAHARVVEQSPPFPNQRARCASQPFIPFDPESLRRGGILIANHAKRVVGDFYRYVAIVFPNWGTSDASMLITNACGDELKPILYDWSQKNTFKSPGETVRWSAEEPPPVSASYDSNGSSLKRKRESSPAPSEFSDASNAGLTSAELVIYD